MQRHEHDEESETEIYKPNIFFISQLAGTVEYTDCFSAEGYNSLKECPRYDSKQSDGEVAVMLKLWGMQSTSSLPSLPGPLLSEW